MSNRADHIVAGALASGCMATYLNKNDPSPDFLTDALSIFIGGWIGSKLPDIIDPPTSPRHRSIGHGMIQSSLLTRKALSIIPVFRKACFDASAEYEVKASKETGIWNLFYRLISFVFKFMAGLAPGILAGYVSHLALDFSTPMCLPLLA